MSMMRKGSLGACAALIALTACTTGQSSSIPPSNASAPVTSSSLQFALGTINFGGVATGINVLETFRGSNGLTAAPINSATLTGPSGFAGMAGSADPGSGSAVVPIGSAHNQFVIGSAGGGTILDAADGFGIGPPASSNSGQNFYPMQPQFGDALATQLGGLGIPGAADLFPVEFVYGGPPAYPQYQFVSSAISSQLQIPSGWSEGFYLIALGEVPAPTGTYTLTVSYSQNGANATQSKQAQLTGPGLATFDPGTVQIVSTGNGGASVTISALPAGVTEAIVNVIDPNVAEAIFPSAQSQVSGAPCQSGLPFATLIFKSAGSQTIPANLGRGGAPTFCTGDTLVAQPFGFDYDDAALGPPNNMSPTPSLPAQADVTVGFPVPGQE